VLVVEDDRELRDVVRRYLERAGHTVHTTGSGAQALSLLATGGVDLIVLDLGLPDVDGLEVLAARQRRRRGAGRRGHRAVRARRGRRPGGLLTAAPDRLYRGFGSVWMLGIAQRHLDRPLRWAGPTVRRSACGAFMVQGLVLIGLAVALRPVPVPAEIKAIAVASRAVLGSFWLAWLLVRRAPGMARILWRYTVGGDSASPEALNQACS
jgi:hypothetical protein